MIANLDDGVSGRLEGVRHVLTLRIYYEDTDFSGAVYHANYLRYMERGRTEILRAIGFDHRKLWETVREGFVVRRMTIDYLRPARMDDVIAITTWVHEVKQASLTLSQSVTRDGETLVTGLAVCAYVRDGRPVRMPERMRKEMARTE
ncbi:tol-pal system-associated acyl-CoA thioesterase [Methylopila sp. Yamaguchi]|uniref:tol-pal system-associated acyl-CoA thioesterase n=1 Tax=Methylopila sp. Yamaguchi TaxID=1437817 RepID=UPI000CAA92D6|nr:tol-pal system-associated acyl-CoA thioesterase [Methylopila sp. Yamaguchi]GBD48411.1 Tol-pal system-associated acyl-CoA thioesterase [Methylopila sp. Yamaguchi]